MSTTKVTLHKQQNEGLVGNDAAQEPVKEVKEDPDELTSEDFKKAAEGAQEKLSDLASSAQQGVANALGSISNAILPADGSKEDPEVQDFRASAAEAAAEAKAFMQPEAPETLEARSREADAKKAAEK